MNKKSRSGRASRLAQNTKGGRQIEPSALAGARFYKPEFLYQDSEAGAERYTYIKGYN